MVGGVFNEAISLRGRRDCMARMTGHVWRDDKTKGGATRDCSCATRCHQYGSAHWPRGHSHTLTHILLWHGKNSVFDLGYGTACLDMPCIVSWACTLVWTCSEPALSNCTFWTGWFGASQSVRRPACPGSEASQSVHRPGRAGFGNYLLLCSQSV